MKLSSLNYFVLLVLLVTCESFIVFISKPDTPYVIHPPLPDSLFIGKNNQVNSLDLWVPYIKSVNASDFDFDITANSALVFDVVTTKTLFTKNENKHLPMASLTKIMTAIIALENKKMDNNYFVHKYDLVGEDSMGLTEGETLTLNELLYGLMLPSGNDAAEVLASNFVGGRNAFIKAMNNKVKALGLANTRFSNPSGLQGDGDQYTTVKDLLVITRYAMMNFSLFREVVKTTSYHIPQNSAHKEFYLENETNLLTTYPGVKGVKTGFTPEAGLCLVTYLEYDGKKVIAILLGSSNRRKEMKELLDYSLKHLGIKPPVSL